MTGSKSPVKLPKCGVGRGPQLAWKSRDQLALVHHWVKPECALVIDITSVLFIGELVDGWVPEQSHLFLKQRT